MGYNVYFFKEESLDYYHSSAENFFKRVSGDIPNAVGGGYVSKLYHFGGTKCREKFVELIQRLYGTKEGCTIAVRHNKELLYNGSFNKHFIEQFVK